MTPNSTAIFTEFAAAINHHDAQAIAALMTPDHVFIDSLGNRMEDAAMMEAGWRGYFAMCPDYQIRIEHLLAEDSRVLAVGEAGGTIDGVAWRTPAAWNALIRDGKVAEFRIFADNKPVYEILAKRQRSS